MTVVDFIDVIDDIIDLSSDEETVQEEHIATQHNVEETVDDRQGVFVLADEGMQDAQAAFVSVGEGSQEATESEDALVATASPSVMEKAPLDTAESENCPRYPASVALPSKLFSIPLSVVSPTTLKALTSEVGDAKLVRVKHPKKNCHTGTPRRSRRLHECCNNSAEELAGDHKTSRA